MAHAATRKGGDAMAAHTAEADDDDESGAKLGEASVGEKDAVAGKLLED